MNFYNRAQTSNKFFLIGAVAIIAIVSLVLFFTNKMEGITQLGIGTYGQGIAQTIELPPYNPFGPTPQVPYSGGPSETAGTRTPFMIFFQNEYGNIADSAACWSDLAWVMAAPEDAFSCFSVPTSLLAEEVKGFFWPTSSAMPTPYYQIGGTIYCYERTPYDRTQLFERLKVILGGKGWEVGQMNGQDVLLCKKGMYFIFPQGLGTY